MDSRQANHSSQSGVTSHTLNTPPVAIESLVFLTYPGDIATALNSMRSIPRKTTRTGIIRSDITILPGND